MEGPHVPDAAVLSCKLGPTESLLCPSAYLVRGTQAEFQQLVCMGKSRALCPCRTEVGAETARLTPLQWLTRRMRCSLPRLTVSSHAPSCSPLLSVFRAWCLVRSLLV